MKKYQTHMPWGGKRQNKLFRYVLAFPRRGIYWLKSLPPSKTCKEIIHKRASTTQYGAPRHGFTWPSPRQNKAILQRRGDGFTLFVIPVSRRKKETSITFLPWLINYFVIFSAVKIAWIFNLTLRFFISLKIGVVWSYFDFFYLVDDSDLWHFMSFERPKGFYNDENSFYWTH